MKHRLTKALKNLALEQVFVYKILLESKYHFYVVQEFLLHTYIDFSMFHMFLLEEIQLMSPIHNLQHLHSMNYILSLYRIKLLLQQDLQELLLLDYQ